MQLKRPAGSADRQDGRGLGVGGEGALGALDPRLGLIRLSLPHQHDRDDHAGHAGRRVAGPAVPLGQFSASCRARPPRERMVKLVRRLVGQAGELQVGPSAPAGQRDAAVQIALGVLGRGHRVLGAAQADQRQRAEVRAQARLRRVRDLGHGLQVPRVGGHGRQVPALAVQQQPDHPEQQPHVFSPAGQHRCRLPSGQGQVPLGRLQRSLRQLIRRGHHRKLGIRREQAGGEPGQQLMHDRGLPVQIKGRPVTGQQPGGQVPILRRLGVPDRLHPEPAGGEPAGGRGVQPGNLTRRRAAQFQPQQSGEHLVIAEPRPVRIQRHHERVRLLQVLQHPLPALVPGQQARPAPR